MPGVCTQKLPLVGVGKRGALFYNHTDADPRAAGSHLPMAVAPPYSHNSCSLKSGTPPLLPLVLETQGPAHQAF